jgi:hypothetical protein
MPSEGQQSGSKLSQWRPQGSQLPSGLTEKELLDSGSEPWNPKGDFHDQEDAKWIGIRTSLRGHNDTPCGRPAPGRPIVGPVSGHPLGVMGGFSYY